MKLYETKIKPGGLMRCCIETIDTLTDTLDDVDYPDGYVLDCKYEKSDNQTIILLDGYWQWNMPLVEV